MITAIYTSADYSIEKSPFQIKNTIASAANNDENFALLLIVEIIERCGNVH
jgi:hypothetical protein